jgi:beta-phosphoglucomutase-like phosphatase (HAD superfamily)
MKLKALLFDFFGTIVKEADTYVEQICEEIARHLQNHFSPHAIAKQWFQIAPKMCFDAHGPDFCL